MSESEEIIFMQVRLARLASEKWHTSVQKTSTIFYNYGIFELIRDCYDLFDTEGDETVLGEIEKILKHKGADVHAELD